MGRNGHSKPGLQSWSLLKALEMLRGVEKSGHDMEFSGKGMGRDVDLVGWKEEDT